MDDISKDEHKKVSLVGGGPRAGGTPRPCA